MPVSADRLKRTQQGVNSLWRTTIPITPSDSTEYDPPLRGLIVTAAGVVEVSDADGTTRALGTIPAGVQLPGIYTKVRAATLATVIGGY